MLSHDKDTPRLIAGRGGRTLGGNFVWTIEDVLVIIGGTRLRTRDR
jgi:hypothetical protein